MVNGRLLANLGASLGILIAVSAIALGLPAVDRAFPADRPVPAGQPYPVGGGVTVVPPADAQVDVTRTRPGPDRGTVMFLIGAVRYAIVVGPYSGSLDEAAARLRRRITDTQGYQVTGEVSQVSTAQGVVGRQGAYTASGRSGRYAVFLRDEVSVEVTVSGAGPEFSAAFDEITASVASIRFEAPA